MKKWILGLLFIAVIAVGSIYILIPGDITVSEVRYIKTFRAAVAKLLTSKEKINQCFGNVAAKTDSTFTYKGFTFSVSKIIFNGNIIGITSDAINVQSNLIPLEMTTDSSSLHWVAVIPAGSNPFNRLKYYYAAKKLKESMAGLMDEMKTYLEHPLNIYGIEVKEIRLSDSLLISTKSSSNHQPGVDEIYGQVKKLQDYASSQGASATNSPMLNVRQIDSSHYEFMVGLPVNKQVSETADIHIKLMPPGGKMLITEIKGGPNTIRNSMKLFDIYKEDAKRTSPAIPFELLITNRAAEPDTSKWITRLYYPVM
ncbi:hypothetical protein [Ferruginibacter profundus]